MAVFNKYIGIFFCLFLLFGCNNDLEEQMKNFNKNAEATALSVNSIMYRNEKQTSSLKNEYNYERFKIVHISDMHIAPWTADDSHPTPNNLKEAIRFANLSDMRINILVATGDFISNNEETTKQKACSFLQSFCNIFFSYENNVPSFLCTGNHDTNMLTNDKSYYLSKQELHQILFAQTNYPQQQPIDENYFYADVPSASNEIFRIISLDNTDQENFDYNSMQFVCFTQKQIDWLINTALKENMTQKHHVIVLTHHPLQAFSKTGNSYMCSGSHLYGEKMIPDIINAFIKQTALHQCYSSCVSPKSKIQVEADFTNCNGNFVCYLGGHTHTPAAFEVVCNDPSQAKQIMLLANTLSPDLQNNKYAYIYREAQTLNSNSFSIYAIDTQEQKIYTTYFGAKRNNSPAIESVSYR